MSTSVTTQATKVTFPNQFTSMAGSLFAPPNMDKTKKYPALAVAHPFGGVKEQTAGIYARKMAEKGYVTLAFDASHQGESGGYPRDTENPAERMEDIRCAIDYLTTLPIVDEDRVGAEARLPCVMTEYRDVFGTALVFARKKQPSKLRFRAKQLKKICGNKGADQAIGTFLAGEVDALRNPQCELIERFLLAAVIFEVGHRNQAPPWFGRRTFSDDNNLLWMGERPARK